MTEKRFYVDNNNDLYDGDNLLMLDFGYNDVASSNRVIDLLNGLAEENNELHEKNQLFNEKEKDMLNYLKKEYDYVYNQRMKHLDDTVLAKCYELIEYHIKSMIEHLEGL